MFISKKKLDCMLAAKEKEVCDRMYQERELQDDRRWMDERFRAMEDRIWKMEVELDKLKGIKEKYDAVCNAVNPF